MRKTLGKTINASKALRNTNVKLLGDVKDNVVLPWT